MRFTLSTGCFDFLHPKEEQLEFVVFFDPEDVPNGFRQREHFVLDPAYNYLVDEDFELPIDVIVAIESEYKKHSYLWENEWHKRLMLLYAALQPREHRDRVNFLTDRIFQQGKIMAELEKQLAELRDEGESVEP